MVVRAAQSPLMPTLVVVSGVAGCIRATLGYPGALEAADGKKVMVVMVGVGQVVGDPNGWLVVSKLNDPGTHVVQHRVPSRVRSTQLDAGSPRGA